MLIDDKLIELCDRVIDDIPNHRSHVARCALDELRSKVLTAPVEAVATPNILSKSPRDEASPKNPDEPLTSYAEIVAALNQQHLDKCPYRNDGSMRRKIGKMNREFDGPIIMPSRGGQPRVMKSKLLKWWSSLGSVWEAMNKQREEAALAQESRRLRNSAKLNYRNWLLRS